MNAPVDLLTSLRNTWESIIDTLPRIALSLLLLVAGWIVARFMRRVAIRVLRWLRVEDLAEKAGVEDFLVQGGIRHTTVTLIAEIVYWMILFATFVAFLNMLGIGAAADLLNRLIEFVPNVVLAIAILLFGALIARIVGSLTYTYLNNIGSAAAEPIAALARYAMLIFVVALAAEQLALNSAILVSGFQIAFGAVCFALALAFGLGGRHWAARVLDRYLKV